MAEETRELEYVLKLNDNISPTAEKATAAEEKLKGSVEKTNVEMNRQNIEFLKNVESLSAFREGVTAVAGGMITLGIVTGKNAERLQKLVAVLNIFVGTAQAIKGIVGIVEMLKTAEIGLAAVETYRAVLKNPAMLGLAIGAGGAAAGVGGYFAAKHLSGGGGGGNTGTTVNQTNNFNGTQPGSGSRQAARGAMEAAGDY